MSSVTLTSIVVNGVTITAQVTETTASQIFNAYKTAAQVLKNALYQTSGGVNPLNSTTEAQITDAINVLRNLMKGETLPIDPNNPNTMHKTYYMTYDMAKNLSLLFQSLNAAGMTVSTDLNVPFAFPDLATAQVWQNLVVTSSILQGIFNVGAEGNQSLQAMVELDYVRTGNDILSTQLSNMEASLKTTKTVLDNLGNLQELHNQIVVDNAGSFTALTHFGWNPGSAGNVSGTATIAQFEAAYVMAASSFYGKALSPRLTAPAGADYISTNAAANWLIQNYDSIQYLGASIRPNTGYVYNTILIGGTTEIPEYVRKQFGIRMITQGDEVTNPSAGDSQGVPPFFTNLPFNYLIDEGIARDASSVILPGALPQDRYKFVNTYRSITDLVIGGYSKTTLNPAEAQLYGLSAAELAANGNIDNLIIRKPATPGSADPLQSEIMHIFSAYPTSFDAAKKELVRVRGVLSAQVANLITANGGPTATVDPNSLLGRLQKVLQDIKDVFIPDPTYGVVGPILSSTPLNASFLGLKNWMLDNYSTRTTVGGAAGIGTANIAGQYQQNITFAITAGQSTNDTQTESVRRFLYVFEEYYKSASAILQQMTQILTRIAQGIAR